MITILTKTGDGLPLFILDSEIITDTWKWAQGIMLPKMGY